ncbi:MAG: FAD:protein FMN transferase [Muribaculaceae bacterium]
MTLSRPRIAIIIATIIGLVVFFASRPKEHYIRISSIVWTTEYHITYKGNCDMTDSINAVFNAIDTTLSMFNPKSIISRINAGEANVAPNPFVNTLLRCSQRINHQTDGYFDPSVAPLVNLWGFGKHKSDSLPSDEAIANALQLVGIDKIRIDSSGKVLKQHPEMVLDFSSIAKGFAADQIGAMFRRNGINNYIVEIGGEIAMHGNNPSGKLWNVSIDLPIESNDTVIHKSAIVLSLTNKGVATSGNYRNYRTHDGKKIVHIINPKTGKPEISDLLSATVIAQTAAEADAYATACMAMGTKRSIQLINRLQHLDAILIYANKDGQLRKWQSPGLKKYLRNLDSEN